MWNITGQEKTVSLLQRSLERGLLAHAYLITGPEHVGKMTLALTLAQALNCKAEKPPCGECETCRRIAGGKHADVQVMSLGQNGHEESRAKTEIGIEQVKALLHTANLPPFEGEHKVYIFDEADKLSSDAANRLLKTLEEPPSKVIFMLLTANERLVLSTVASRCQRLELSRLTADDVESALVKRSIEPGKARLLSRLCNGCLGWAVTAAGDPALLQQRTERLNRLIELVHNDYTGRFEAAAQLALQFGKKRETVYETLECWIGWWRDMLLLGAGCREAVINIDFLPTLVEMSQDFSLYRIKEAVSALLAARQELKLNASPRLVLEVLMLSIPGVDRKIKSG